MQELARALLDRIDAGLDAQALSRYRDPGMRAPRSAAEIPAGMSIYASTVARTLRLQPSAIDEALGCHLTEPKPGVSFTAPSRLPPPSVFKSRLRGSVLTLDRGTRMLHRNGRIYINGEIHVPASGEFAPLKRLADRRELAPDPRAPEALLQSLHRWYAYGWIHLSKMEHLQP
jgi:50S ribosomal protein L16 3-hydroxylase